MSTQAESQTSAEWRAENPRSGALHERASRQTPGGVHHNLRSVSSVPLFFERASGAHKWDVDGHRYIDYALGQGSLLLGHQDEKVIESIRERASFGVPGASHELELRWSELVQEMIPSAERVRFLASGTESTMLAMRLARAHTGRDKIVRFEGHYHGWHDYGMFGYRPPFDGVSSDGIPALVGDSMVTLPATAEGAERLVEVLAAEDVAGVILEPSGASWGTVPLPPGFCASLRRATEETGTVLIFDEVITGFRWAPGGAQERFGVMPDLTTLGKIVSGGLPGGAIAGRAEIFDLLRRGADPQGRYVLHHGTFNGHPLIAAAGVATLEQLRSGEAQRKADVAAATLRTDLRKLIEELGVGACCYGEASVYHVYLQAAGEAEPDGLEELAKEPGERSGRPLPAAPTLLGIDPQAIDAMALGLQQRGLDLFSYNGGMTSAVHGSADLDATVTAFGDVLSKLRDEGLVARR